ncbi:MAG: hypothetical protein SFH39_00080 [Candidatus Magnetobacterium sp. LHC-1]
MDLKLKPTTSYVIDFDKIKTSKDAVKVMTEVLKLMSLEIHSDAVTAEMKPYVKPHTKPVHFVLQSDAELM